MKYKFIFMRDTKNKYIVDVKNKVICPASTNIDGCKPGDTVDKNHVVVERYSKKEDIFINHPEFI